MLSIKNLRVSVEGKEILKGIGLEVGPGQLHVLMGPNGSGKSTLAQVIMGSPSYTAVDGWLTVDGKDITKLSPDKRAKLGIFLAFQHPVEIPGVTVFNVLRRARAALSPVASFPPASARFVTNQQVNLKSDRKLRAVGRLLRRATGATTRNNGPTNGEGRLDVKAFREELVDYLGSLKLSEDFLRRSLNEGFSGGEKKRNEALQLLALKPRLAILDEIDSGLDVDALKLVASAIKRFTVDSPQSSVLLITHYARILKYLKPDFVHIMMAGRIIKSGAANLAQEIEERGYTSWLTA